MADLFQDLEPAIMSDPFAEVASPADSPPAVDPEFAAGRARIAAMGSTPVGPDYLANVRAETERLESMITKLGEGPLEVDLVERQRQDDVRNLVNLMDAGPQFDESGEVRRLAQSAVMARMNEDAAKRQQYIIEQQFVRKVQELAMAGNTAEATMMLNMMEHGSPLDMIADFEMKRMILAREIERAKIAKEDQPWMLDVSDFVMSVIPLNISLGQSGNVDIPKALQNWYDGLFSGERVRNEVATLYNMPIEEFTDYVRDELIPNVKENSTLLGYHDKSEQLNILSQFDQTDPAWQINAFNALDNFGMVPLTKIGKAITLPSQLSRQGARSAASAVVAERLSIAAAEGEAVAVRATGMTEDVALDAARVSAVNSGDRLTGVPIATEVERLRRGTELLKEALGGDELLQSGRLLPSELTAATERVATQLKNEFDATIKDVDMVPKARELSDGSKTFYVEFTVGRRGGGGYKTEASAAKAAKALGYEGAIPVRDVGGQWYLKLQRDIPETGFFSTEIKSGTETFLGRRILNARSISDKLLGDMSQMSLNTRSRLISQVVKPLAKPFRSLRAGEKVRVDAAAAAGEQAGRWFDDNELSILWRDAFKKEISQRELDAMRALQDLNDIEYAVRNDDLYKKLVVSGAQQAEFVAGGIKYQGPAFIDNVLPESGIKVRAFNVTDGVHIQNVTREVMEELSEKGYILTKLPEAMTLSDGTTVRFFLGHKDSFLINPLDRVQLAYRAGGHRFYDPQTVTHFARQTVRGVQPDTGKMFLKNPNTYIGGTRAEVQAWVTKMEQARQVYKSWVDNLPKKKRNAKAVVPDSLVAQIDEIFDGQPGFPTGDEFVKGMDGVADEHGIVRRQFEPDEPFVLTEDRVMPEAYYKVDNEALQFADLEEGGFNGWLRTTGRMYYGRKGTQLQDWLGRPAPVLNAYETINRSLMNVAQLSSFGDYKIASVERWITTYGGYLADNVTDASNFRKFLEGTYRPGVPSRIVQAAEAQREIIKRNLAWKTEIDRVSQQETRRFKDWMMGDDPLSSRHKIAGDVIKWWGNSNALQALRGLAFDLKMGLFNVAQFPMQISTMWAAMTLSPKHSMSAMMSMPLMMLARAKSAIDYKWAAKVGGFADEFEAREFVKGYKSGFFDLNQHVVAEHFGPHAALSAIGSKADDIRQAGRFFFYEAERWNRNVAYRIAWGEAMEKFGRQGIRSDEFNRFLWGRAEDYSLGMSQTSASWWQQGLLSIPTQFWAYNARMFEAMFGGLWGDKTFTTAARMRLILGQIVMWGAAGTPITSAVNELWKYYNPDKPDGVPNFERGLIDQFIFHTTGQNVAVSERMGVGGFIPDTIRKLFGVSAYGPVSPAEFLGGATFNITGQTAGTLFDLGRYIVAESGEASMPLTRRALERLARNISTYNNVHKAQLVFNYGLYESTRGGVTADDLPKSMAFAVALGFTPGELTEMYESRAWLTKKDDQVREAVRVIRDYRVKLANQPDKAAELSEEINAYVRLLPPDIRARALARVGNETPDSAYDTISERIEREMTRAQMMDQ